jgi:hypothetical protein
LAFLEAGLALIACFVVLEPSHAWWCLIMYRINVCDSANCHIYLSLRSLFLLFEYNLMLSESELYFAERVVTKQKDCLMPMSRDMQKGGM